MQGFIPTGIAAADMHFNSRLDKKFGQSQWSMKCRSSAPCHSKWFLSVSRAIAIRLCGSIWPRCTMPGIFVDIYFLKATILNY